MILETKIKKLVIFISLVAIFLSFSLPVFAHRVILYAYVEGNKIIAEGAFGDGSPAKDAEIMVYNKQGELLAEAKTNENGICEIEIPKKTDLEIKMNAGMGHQAEYALSESKLPEINNKDAAASTSKAEVSYNNLSEEKLREVVAEELDKKLTPIKKSIIESNQDSGPGLTEIIGGIGYIFGLMGVASYFKKGKK
ncbi:nickel transport protein [Halanaerobium saccharolyticum]|uniref:Nickel transport protein n=1 Tax=Halanaerobium saccharolyticum TaxID=43595 RepID=A0A4R7Z602_9FIRM|nr:hypothetical protein [Halanaerobium saccharolyticum]RAK10583.1 nickel transport protein [Halanaerobium saccharolyticum]TDW06660.1 nickel transport protein [Halanaerobium saccharolyticum]TDX62295.1 nickel transport protein [Halanaerobium saccharolyticum]